MTTWTAVLSLCAGVLAAIFGVAVGALLGIAGTGRDIVRALDERNHLERLKLERTRVQESLTSARGEP